MLKDSKPSESIKVPSAFGRARIAGTTLVAVACIVAVVMWVRSDDPTIDIARSPFSESVWNNSPIEGKDTSRIGMARAVGDFAFGHSKAQIAAEFGAPYDKLDWPVAGWEIVYNLRSADKGTVTELWTYKLGTFIEGQIYLLVFAFSPEGYVLCSQVIIW